MKVDRIFSGKRYSYVVVNDIVVGFGVDKKGKNEVGKSVAV